jgi:DNA-binding NarL/FixJ family response regulator
MPHTGDKYFQASGPGIETLVEKMQQFEAHKEVITKRECKIIRMLANGKTITEVAKEMFVSKSTIEKNLSELCRKFKVRNRAELIAYSLSNDMI